MASNEDYGVEDISPTNSSGDESSDDESVSDGRPPNRRIAHKEMKHLMNETEKGNNTQPVEAPKTESSVLAEEKPQKDDLADANIEVNASAERSNDNKPEKNSNIQTTDEQIPHEKEKTDPGLSTSTDFEDISDEGEENEAFSPMEDENANNDDGISQSPVSDTPKDELRKEIAKQDSPADPQDNVDEKVYPEEILSFDEPTDSKPYLGQDVDDNYIEAPIPSPFSDIGDISGSDHAIISDILKETGDGNHISSELEGFATQLQNLDEPVDIPYATRDGIYKKISIKYLIWWKCRHPF